MGPTGTTGPSGADGVGSIANGSGSTTGFAAGNSCATDMQITLTLPANSPAGRIVVTGWMRYVITHTVNVPDKIMIYVGTSSPDCGTSDAFRSYAAVAPAIPTGNIEGMVPIQNQFVVPAGGGSYTFFLNTKKLQGGAFVDASANIEAVFHKQG